MGTTFSLKDWLGIIGSNQTHDNLMPVLFVGHGNPMNAIEQNKFTQVWNGLGKNLPKPKAILCISAHWQTNGTFVTAMDKPRTIHDFYGFPQELFNVNYAAPGSVTLADATCSLFEPNVVKPDMNWGLDHGSWSVLKPMYPLADIPVLQLSLDVNLNEKQHYELAKNLFELRKNGVLIVGSGNIVHNLQRINWQGGAYDWAIEFDQVVKDKVNAREFGKLTAELLNYKSAQLSIPTNEHYLPLMYVLSLITEKDNITHFNEEVVMGSISMRGIIAG